MSVSDMHVSYSDKTHHIKTGKGGDLLIHAGFYWNMATYYMTAFNLHMRNTPDASSTGKQRYVINELLECKLDKMLL